MCASRWLVWCVDTCRPQETKAYSFLALARGLGYRAMPPYLWSWDHRVLEWNSGSLWLAWRGLHQRHLCRREGCGVGPLFFSQKVWNGQGFTLTGVEFMAPSKQSPSNCLYVARVFSLKLEVCCTCTVFPRWMDHTQIGETALSSRPPLQVCEICHRAQIAYWIYKPSLA